MPEITNFGSIEYDTISAPTYAGFEHTLRQLFAELQEDYKADGIDEAKISKEEREQRFSAFMKKKIKAAVKNRRKSGAMTRTETLLNLRELKDPEGNLISTLPDGEEPQHGLSFELQPLKGLPFTISRSQRYETGKLFVSPLLAHSESDQDAVISVQPSSGTYTMLRPEIQTLVCALVHFVCRQTGARTVTYHFARSKIRTLNIHFRLLEQPVKHPARLLNDLAVYLSEEWEKNRAKTS